MQPHLPRAHQGLAETLLRLAQPSTALGIYRSTTEPFTHDPSARLRIARLAEAAGDRTTALEGYREALRLDPSCIEALAFLANAYFYGGMPKQARI